MPPTFVNFYESTWLTNVANGGSITTASVTCLTGDFLVVCGAIENASITLGTPAGGGLTYTLQVGNPATGSGNSKTWIWTAPVTAGGTFTVASVKTGAGNHMCGLGVYVFRNAGLGTGENNSDNLGTGALMSVTTGAANSAVVYIEADWNAIDGTTRTWATVNSITPTVGNSLERVYQRNSATYGAWSAYWNDAGAAGANSYGAAVPTGRQQGCSALEIQFVAGAATLPPILVMGPRTY